MKAEKFDTQDVIEKKVDQLAEFIRRSSHFIGFTGAGISTSAGIPDYRSGHNTVLETGPGKWVSEETQKMSDEQYVNMPSQYKKTYFTLAQPTYAHLAVQRLLEEDMMKFLISQNIDGLHRRSGVEVHQISELHGNSYLEICGGCGKDYMRDHRCRNPKNTKTIHLTGRMCDSCGTELQDTIVNFGESLPLAAVEAAKLQTSKADLCLSLGSSLQVKPAMLFPLSVGKRGHLAIVNLQPTPLDKVASIRIWGKVDEVMRLLMERLDLSVDLPQDREQSQG